MGTEGELFSSGAFLGRYRDARKLGSGGRGGVRHPGRVPERSAPTIDRSVRAGLTLFGLLLFPSPGTSYRADAATVARFVVTAPELVSVEELGALSIEVVAPDPAGGRNQSLTADLAGLPAGHDAVFTASSLQSSGTLFWHPRPGDVGTYRVTFVAIGRETVSASTLIRVFPRGTQAVGTVTWMPATGDTGTFTVTFTALSNDNTASTAKAQIRVLGRSGREPSEANASPGLQGSRRGPALRVVGATVVRAGELLRLSVGALDPNGRPILSLRADLRRLPRTNPAHFSASLDPQVWAPPVVKGRAGEPIELQVLANDPDGEAIASLAPDLSGLPEGAAFEFTTDGDRRRGVFRWTPEPHHVRDLPYAVTFRAANRLVGSATSEIRVLHANRDPVANAGGPHTAVVGVPVALDGSRSSDPDGDLLVHSWDFGDGYTALGPTPSHAYDKVGDFLAILTVQDTRPQSSLSGLDTALVHVVQELPVAATVPPANRVVQLGASNAYASVRLKSRDGAFAVTDVDLGSIALASSGTGTVEQIAAVRSKTGIVRDLNGSGRDEISAHFSREDLRRLFSNIGGRREVQAQVTGQLTSGARFGASVTLEVVAGGSGSGIPVTVAPNPFNPQAVLSFELSEGGTVRIQIFDLNGRLVRDLAPGGHYFGPGLHQVTVEARDRNGGPLPSGVYFYRLTAPEGVTTGQMVVMD